MAQVRFVVLACVLTAACANDDRGAATSTPTIPSTSPPRTGTPSGSSTFTIPSGTPADIVPLFDASTPLQPLVVEDTGDALITRFGDRGRDRHAREDVFAAYDHYLSHYWEYRTISAEIIDTVGRDPLGGEIRFEVTTQYKLSDNQAELRFF